MAQLDYLKPSALDSPRFFDDAALSGWSVGSTRRVAAPKEAFATARAYARASGKDPPVPDLQDEAEPIPVELVRGANGPQDEDWTVVVDGLRCKPERLNDKSFRVKLPHGIPWKPITRDTKVRPVSVAIRLENEAQRPLSAELFVVQKIKSIERTDGSDADDKQLGGRVPLQPYRTADVTAKTVTLPYPFWSPTQSVLGVLSFNAANRANERKQAALAFNAFARVTNGVQDAAYRGRSEAYRQFRMLQTFEEFVTTGFGKLQKLTNEINPAQPITKEQFDKLQVRITKPKRPKKITYRETRLYDGTVATGESFVFGGGSVSAVEQLADYCQFIAKVCEDVRKQANDAHEEKLLPIATLSLREQLGAIRFALLTEYEGSEEHLVFLDALLNADAFPPASFLLDASLARDTDEPVLPISQEFDKQSKVGPIECKSA